MERTDCLIVGAGPVGLATACLLRHHGIDCRLVEKLEAPSVLTKAAGIWSRTTEVLDSMGLAQRFIEAGNLAHGGNIFGEGRRLVHLDLTAVDSPFNFLLMLPQHETELLLVEHLEQLGGKVERGLALTSLQQDAEGVDCGLGDTQIRASYVVGCDGAHSTVRKQLALPFEGRPEDDMWMVGDVTIHGPLPEDEIFVYLAEEGTMALFPLGDHRYRVAAIAGPDHDPDSQSPSPEIFEGAILKRGPAGLNVSGAENLWYFRIHERQVPHYRVGRVFLAGDAAHIHSPMGGQGMNTGIQDAFNLAWKLAMVVRGQAGERLLDSYHLERHPVAEKVIRGTTWGTHAMTLKSTVGQHIRNRVMGLVSKLPLFQSRVPRVAAEIDIHYRQSPLSLEPHALPHGWLFNGGVASGNRAPNAVVFRGSDHQPVSLFELLREPHFQLLLLSGISPGPDYGRLKAIAQWVGSHHADLITPHIVCAHPDAPTDLPGLLHDPQHDLHHQHAAAQESLVLIRPDGHVAHRSQPADLDALQRYLQLVLH